MGYKKEPYTNISWEENNKWYGWKYNDKLNRYYFDDIGNDSIISLWEYLWAREEKDLNNKMFENQVDFE
ncbi:hypothetical protein EB001_26865 [bacterium]|nr:hypothetical protein [bacterium]